MHVNNRDGVSPISKKPEISEIKMIIDSSPINSRLMIGEDRLKKLLSIKGKEG